jgi:hypothetical protein
MHLLPRSRRGNFNFTDYAAYAARLDTSWGYIFKEATAPVWLGEWR